MNNMMVYSVYSVKPKAKPPGILRFLAAMIAVLSLHQPARMVLAPWTPILLPRAFALAYLVRVHMNPGGHLTLIAPAFGADPVELTILYGSKHLSTRSHA